MTTLEWILTGIGVVALAYLGFMAFLARLFIRVWDDALRHHDEVEARARAELGEFHKRAVDEHQQRVAEMNQEHGKLTDELRRGWRGHDRWT